MKKKRRVALLMFFDKRRRILIQDRRSISKVGEEWGWFGGEIEKDETPEQTVRREIKEELNYDLKDITHLMHHQYFLKALDKWIIADVFIAPAPPMNKLKQEEGDDMKFFTLEEARKLKMVSKPDSYRPIDAIEEWFEFRGKEEKVFFKNSYGERLAGILKLPATKNPPVIIITHGFGGFGFHEMFDPIEADLLKKGFAAFRFMFAGYKPSEGNFKELTIEKEVEDLKSAFAFAKKLNIDSTRIGILAQSLGCAVSAIASLPAKCYVFLAPSINTAAVFNREVKRGATLNEKFWTSTQQYKRLDLIKKLGRPLLIIHGDKDSRVTTEEVNDMFKLVKNPKKLVTLKDAPHTFIRGNKYISKVVPEVTDWFKKYLK